MAQCGAEINYPPTTCERPRGHAGEHTTTQIPPPLAAAAARVILEGESLATARDDFARESERLRRARFGWIAINGAALGILTALVIAQLVQLAALFGMP